MDTTRLGEVAYNAYCEERDWLSVSGNSLPQWHEQDPDLRDAWDVAAKAVADAVSLPPAAAVTPTATGCCGDRGAGAAG